MKDLVREYRSGRGFSYDFSKVMTNLPNKIIIAGSIGPGYPDRTSQ